MDAFQSFVSKTLLLYNVYTERKPHPAPSLFSGAGFRDSPGTVAGVNSLKNWTTWEKKTASQKFQRSSKSILVNCGCSQRWLCGTNITISGSGPSLLIYYFMLKIHSKIWTENKSTFETSIQWDNLSVSILVLTLTQMAKHSKYCHFAPFGWICIKFACSKQRSWHEYQVVHWLCKASLRWASANKEPRQKIRSSSALCKVWYANMFWFYYLDSEYLWLYWWFFRFYPSHYFSFPAAYWRWIIWSDWIRQRSTGTLWMSWCE